jgi:putative hemin transport protein
MAISNGNDLRERFARLKEEQPKLRIRDAARVLEVSELELLELGLEQHVVRLQGSWTDFLQEAHLLGYVMALTRNEYAVHERKGVYDNVSFMHDGKMGVAVNPDIDLRFLMWNWQYGYAVRTESANGRSLYSFQFFDSRGTAVHKIFLTNSSFPQAYEHLLEKYRAGDQQTLARVGRRPLPLRAVKPDEEVEVAAFKEAWLDLQDTHDFFPLLKQHGLDRLQALRLAPEGYAQQVSSQAVAALFHKAAAGQVPIMVFVNSTGCIQIHTGLVKKLVPMGDWFNVMDPDFNLHLNTKGIAQAWIVKKPTRDGLVTSLEAFDEQGELIVYCFGKRKPGEPELPSWRELVQELSLTLV